ncbi:MAG: type 4a pilus biogenesis protein PilO [Candidatus Omnitrophota bacterium]|nr:type 4a pilus biogenesis protein PilO [Candidatus Omnitrophota bacterium]
MKTKKTTAKPVNKLVIASAAIIILTLATGVVFIYRPFAGRNTSLRTEILKERDKNILIGKIRAYAKHLKVYEKRIPESGGVSWLLGEISNIASKEKIEIGAIKPGNPEDYGLYTKVSVIIDSSSTYEQLGRFIAAVESAEKFLKIENVNIKRMDIDENFKKGSGRFKAFDIKANIVISSIVPKE